MSNGSGDQEAYAAANLRERLREIDLSESKEAYPHAGLVEDDQTRMVLNQLALAARPGEDITQSRAYQDLVQPAGTETITKAVGDGNVSQMQYAVGLVDHAKDGDDALTRFARALSREGAIGLVVGPPGAGKTATTLDTSRVWKALTGGTVVSNITSWPGTDIEVHDNQEMIEAMQSVQGQVLAVIDEAAQYLTSRGSDQEATNYLAKELKLVRKREAGDQYAKQGSVLFVGHTRKDTAAELRRLASVVLEKPSRQDPGRATLFESAGGQDVLDQVGEFKGLTDTAESYGEHEASHFEVVIDDGDEDGDDQVDADDVDKRRQVETALRACLIQGMNYKEAAQLVDFGDTWVGERVREWRRGEWCDLLDEGAVPDEHATA